MQVRRKVIEMNKNKKICNVRIFIALLMVSYSISGKALSHSGMVELEDSDLREVSGQGLFVADMIRGDELTGANEYSTPFNFYRVGMDGEMQLNLNMTKLQLGCGGVNDFLSGHAGCDIDIDYVSMMGRDGYKPGDPQSPVTLDRPYMEFAIKNDDTHTMREVVGIKIGAATVDGFMATGRRYYNGVVNEENTGFGSTCNPSDFVGANVVGCHSGLNSVSGFLGTDLSLTMRVKAAVAGLIPLDAWGCTGRTTTTVDECGTSQDESIFVDLAGTRMQSLGLRSAVLTLNGDGIVSLLQAIGLNDVYAQLNADARTVHGLAFAETGDFFLSFQREPVAYPRYAKVSPTEEFTEQGLMGVALDACATTTHDTPRCHSAYAVPANTGWWMNAPSAKLVDVFNDDFDLGNVSIGGALELLGAPGFLIENPELNFHRAQNCYGSSKFC